MSSQAYLFAHRALPVMVFTQPGRVLPILAGPDSQRFLLDAWENAGKHCDPAGRREPRGLTCNLSATGTTGVVAVVHLPEPQEEAEAHLLAIFGRFEDPEQPDLGRLKWVRLFTLERGLHPVTERRCTMLCEWTDQAVHKNYGEGPPPDEELFVQAALDLLWQQKERAEEEDD